MDIGKANAAFGEVFGSAAEFAVQAPGRVNLIGEHTDYNDGFVLPIAIGRRTVALAARRRGRLVRFASLQQAGEPAAVELDKPIEPAQPRWANYPRGVLAGLVDRGLAPGGADVLFDSDVPLGGGLSSSASLEVAAALALLAAWGAPRRGAAEIPPRELAVLCQQAEHRFADSPCGIMDQSIAIMGKKGHALLLDCRDGSTRHIPFGDERYVLLVADTQVKHSISDGGYAARRRQCESAAKKLRLRSLRDASGAAVGMGTGSAAPLSHAAVPVPVKPVLEGKELMRARHVVGEIARTLAAAEALSAGDYGRFGELMYASHASLRDDYEVSCAELDAIVEFARGQAGVLGARMTGGGFGGCAIVLAEASRAQATGAAVQRLFAARFGRVCPIFATGACQGAGRIAD